MATADILVVDDEPDIRSLLQEILEDEGYEVHTASDAKSAQALKKSHPFDLILLDIWMPDVDGITLLKDWSTQGTPDTPVIMLSGHGTVETAVEATRLGAYDYLEKPLSLAKLLVTVQGALSHITPHADNIGLRRQANRFFAPIGKSATMNSLREQVRRLARHSSPTLLSGEAGSGKGVLSRYLHSVSDQADEPFVHLEAAILHDQPNAELALVGNNGHQGYLERAGRGTLFINDIADLDLQQQLQLFGILKTRSYSRSGGETRPLECRIIAATRFDIPALIEQEQFRADLYYLLESLRLPVPPLREHSEDVPELLAFHVDQLVAQENLPFRRFTMAAQNRLRQYRWPGNVRELKNLVRHFLLSGRDDDIDVEEVAVAQQQPSEEQQNSCLQSYRLPLREARDMFEKEYFLHLLREYSGSVSKVAQHAGVERTHLYRKLRSLNIDPKQAVR